MKTTKHSKLLSVTLLSAIASTTAWSPVVSAGNTGVAVIGGLLAGHVLTNAVDRDKQRTADMNSMANSQQQRASAPPSGGDSSSPEARIKQLDKLAAGGYITPAEYKAKKKAILDSM